MKKLIPLILAAALTLAACASASDETPLTTPTPAPEAPEPTSTPAPATTDFYPLESYTTAFNTGDAYYELVQYPGHALLLKTDYATAAQTVCCTMQTAPTTVKPARPISRGGRGGTQFLRQEIPSMSTTHCSTAIPKLGRNTLTSTASPS